MSAASLRTHSHVWRIGAFATAPLCNKRRELSGRSDSESCEILRPLLMGRLGLFRSRAMSRSGP